MRQEEKGKLTVELAGGPQLLVLLEVERLGPLLRRLMTKLRLEAEEGGPSEGKLEL